MDEREVDEKSDADLPRFLVAGTMCCLSLAFDKNGGVDGLLATDFCRALASSSATADGSLTSKDASRPPIPGFFFLL
jgi:hypothetical protein